MTANSSLAAVFGLVRDALPSTLVGDESLALIADITTVAPSFAMIGFESRLADEDAPIVDVQLGATAGRDAAAALRSLTVASERDALPPAWEPVLRLCREWQMPGSAIARGVAEVWCELDLAPGATTVELATLAPSVFVTLASGTSDQRRATIDRTLELLLPADALPPLQAVLERCFRACGDHAAVSHIGLMLGRSVHALRIHLSRVRLG